jgi:molybdate transport system regulatory protein
MVERHETPKLTLRVDLGAGRALGPGKVRLLEAIERTGSISEAGRELGMSYKRAWELVDDLKSCFRAPVVERRRAGASGGGTAVTPFGILLVKFYRGIEAEALSSVGKHFDELEVSLKHSAASRPVTSIRRPLLKTKA